MIDQDYSHQLVRHGFDFHRGHMKRGNGVSRLAIYGISALFLAPASAEKMWWTLNFFYTGSNHQTPTEEKGGTRY